MPQGHLIAVHVEDATAAAELHNEVHFAALGKGQFPMGYDEFFQLDDAN